jgi:hypothetical protein
MFRGRFLPPSRRLRSSGDGRSKDLENVRKFLPDYTAQQPRRQSSSEDSQILLCTVTVKELKTEQS